MVPVELLNGVVLVVLLPLVVYALFSLVLQAFDR